jgi:hypothetical protein
MQKIRMYNLDTREYFTIENYGTIIAHNGTVQSKEKGNNWTMRQTANGYSHDKGYSAAVATYGQVMLMGANSPIAEFVETLNEEMKKFIGKWNGCRIVTEYQNSNGNNWPHAPPTTGKFSDISRIVSALGKAYLKYDKVLV